MARYKIEYRDESTWDAVEDNHSGEVIEFELPYAVAIAGVKPWVYGCGLLFLNNWVQDNNTRITLWISEGAGEWRQLQQEGGVKIPND